MFTGTKTLIGLILRRDRIKLPLWIIGITTSLIAMVPVLRDVYGDEASLTTLYQTFSLNPAGLFLTGPMDAPNFGALMTIETILWWGLAIAFMNTLLIVRHTRQNEEIGAQELILSGQVHRGTSLVAILIVAFLANGLIAVGMGAGLAALETSLWTTDQAWLYGLAMGLFGFAWAAIAAVIAQLVESARSANGILAGLIGVAFLLRGIGDFMGTANADGVLQPTWLSWLSPFGWLQATRPLTLPEWWPLIVPGIFVVASGSVAFFLLSKRDVGAGILPARRGRPRATRFLGSPLGLTWHLQKNIFIGWLIGVVAMVVTIGVLVPEMTHVYESSENMKTLIAAMGGTGAIIPAFLSAMLSIVVLMVIAYAIQGLGKLRGEESSGHLENLLATKLSRMKWMGLHSIVVIFGGTLMLAISGGLLALCVNVVSDYQLDIWEYTVAGLSYFPLLFIFAGMYIILFGLLPRIAGLVLWVYYGFVAFMSWLGPLLKFDQQILDLSLLTHLAAAPGEEIVARPLIIFSIVALGLFIIGSAAWRHRNLLER
jgi:ABC-2 type transport system permease protein